MFFSHWILTFCYKKDLRQMLKIFQLCSNAICTLVNKIWSYFCFFITKEVDVRKCNHIIRYEKYPVSPLSGHRLNALTRRKIFVLDLDETLIHSDNDSSRLNRSALPPDYILKVTIDKHPVKFFVHKRPFVDYFLETVAQWYELVIFTASMEVYGSRVVDMLDNKRGILNKRYYRQHCTPEFGSYTKDLSVVTQDLAKVFILDNSPSAYKDYPDNAIPIKSWFYDPADTCLLALLPVLDALRFTHDVRSVLSRNMHIHWRYNTTLSSIINSIN